MIAAEFARFLGLQLTRRANITDIIEAVCGVCTDTRTSVICVDEIVRHEALSDRMEVRDLHRLVVAAAG